MLQIIDKNNKDLWNKIVKQFNNWDIYFLFEYAYSFYLHGDGEPLLIYYYDNYMSLCYVMMKRDISLDKKFTGMIPHKTFYDLETPYGYGGIIYNGTLNSQSEKCFSEEFLQYCSENNIVSQFIRFHPLLDNYNIFNDFFETKYMRDTIYVDTTEESKILANMDSKNRNLIRKAIKNGVTIVERNINDYCDFLDMYNETMIRNCADSYYIFDKNYFESLSHLSENSKIFYAMLEGKPISGAIIYFNDNFAHYHLSGSNDEARKLCASNLLLYEVSKFASRHNISMFHLGGGMSPNDSLFSFKKQFNKNGMKPFYVGRTIFNKNAYNYLLNIRKEHDENFDLNNNFMIQYRK